MASEQDDNSPATDSLSERQADFRSWVERVRDPAREKTEGIRSLGVLNGAATADYEIAPLPDGRWAITGSCAYRCGNCHGLGIPWSDFDSRDACLEFFLKIAREHFRRQDGSDRSERQQQAQKLMWDLLADGLFGFVEPTSGRSRTD